MNSFLFAISLIRYFLPFIYLPCCFQTYCFCCCSCVIKALTRKLIVQEIFSKHKKKKKRRREG